MSKENFSTGSMVLLSVLKTRVKKPGGQLGMNPKWFCKTGETMLQLLKENKKFGQEDYQMLLLSIDRKNSQRDELLSIFIIDKMREITDFNSVKKIWGSFFQFPYQQGQMSTGGEMVWLGLQGSDNP